VWSVLHYGARPQVRELPVLGSVPEFSLVSSNGSALTQADLAGDIWVADFIFTTCPGMCSVLSAQMARVQRALSEQADVPVRLVSFSVDPANDTPEVLQRYGARFGADPQRWWFVTGERAALYSLIQKGFFLAIAERDEDPDGEGLITHSDRFVLVDAEMRIRGYYHGMENDDINRLLGDIALLQREAS
jgi:protein SCO1/2